MATRNLKAWTGSAWAAKPLKYWTGTEWREAQLKWADADGAWLPVVEAGGFGLTGVATAGQWNGYGDTNAARVVSAPITTTAGRGLVVLIGYEGVTDTPVLSDSKGNPGWTVSAASPVTSQYGFEVYLRVAFLPLITNAGTGHTVTAAWLGEAFAHMAVYEVELPEGQVLALDVREFTTDNTAPYEGSITPLAADVLAFAHVVTAGGPNDPSLPSAPGWTFQFDKPFTDVNWPFVTGTRSIAGGAATAMSLTLGGAQDNETLPIGLTTFKAVTPVPWTPAALVNAKAWYIADNPANTVDGGLTTALADAGGSGYGANAVNAGASMSDSLNGRPVLRTSGGAGIFMSLTGGDAIARTAGGVSIFTVHRQISRDGAGYPAVASASFGAGTNTLQIALLREQDGHQPGSINLRTRPNNYSGGIEVADETNYGTEWLVAGGSRRFNHDDGMLWVNGAETYATMDADDVTQDIDMSLIVGGYSAWAGDEWTQNIAEVIFVRDDVAPADRLRIEGYLAWEWGLQGNLIDGHPYKAGRPMLGGADAVPPGSTTPTWNHVAAENQSFTLAAPGHVRYGAGSSWIELDLPAGAHECSNEAFGDDPISGTAKTCQLLT